jgi:hypothetical protein
MTRRITRRQQNVTMLFPRCDTIGFHEQPLSCFLCTLPHDRRWCGMDILYMSIVVVLKEVVNASMTAAESCWRS